MKIQNKIRIIIIGVIVCILWIAIPAIYLERNSKDDIYGSSVLIKGDTLMVVGFDMDTQNYILDDGRQVAERMVELFKLEE